MPSYLCDECGERMTLKKAAGKAKTKKCPTCHNHSMKKESGMGGIDPGAFGF